MSDQPYYVPESSKLPFMMAITMLVFIIGSAQTVINLDNPDSNAYLILIAFFIMLWTVMYFWFREVIQENHAGLNNPMLKDSYVFGMAWFIFSEVMFFFAFFFALAYIRNFAVPWLGGEGEKAISNILWPGFEASWPLMITPDQAVFAGPEQDMTLGTAYSNGGLAGVLGWLPLWNTVFLLTSSLTVHIAHLALKNGNRKKFNIWLGLTLVLGYMSVSYTHLKLTTICSV